MSDQMNSKDPTLEQLDAELRRAAEILDQCANMIRDLPLEPSRQHIRKIGDALTNVFEIQHKIYEVRPDLMPEFLKERPSPRSEDT